MTSLETAFPLRALQGSTARITFVTRPIPLNADYRPIWRVPLLALMLRVCCRGAQSSLKRLHILNWAVRTPSAGRELLSVLDGTRRPGDVIVRVEPTLNLVIDLAQGEGIVTFPHGDRVQLTSLGIKVADELVRGDCLKQEKALFQRIGKALTEDWVGKIIQVGTRGSE